MLDRTERGAAAPKAEGDAPAKTSPAEADGGAAQAQSAELMGAVAPGGEALRATLKGHPQGVPYRAEMEARFGQDFSTVQAFLGEADDMARRGAHAAASGEIVAFAEASPAKERVAHELTHVVQARGGAAPKRGTTSSKGDAAEQEARAGTGAVREAPSAEVMLDAADTVNEARRRALEIKDALLDHWTEDEEKALRQIRGQSTLMLREIRAQYAAVTGGRVLENDFREYCNSRQYQEALSILWSQMSLEDRLRSNVEPGWLWNSANEEGILDVLRTASADQLAAAAQSPRVMRLLRDNLNDAEYYDARKLLTPNDLFDAVMERIRNAESWWNDDESAVYSVILDLNVGDRRRLWNENPRLFDFMSADEKQGVRRMCLGTEADALDERMRRATDGLGTDDDAVALVAQRTQEAAQRERVIGVALQTGARPDGQQLSAEETARLQQAQADLGGVQQNLLTVQRDAGGNIASDSFLGRLHGDVSEAEFQAFAGNMGASQYELAKQQILDAIGTFDDDEASINQAFERLVGAIELPEGQTAASLDPATRAQRQQAANAALRQRLWNDPDVQAALAHLNREERQVAADYAAADPYQIALHELADAYHGIDTDENRIFRIVTGMSAADRARLLTEQPRIWSTMMVGLTRQEAALVREAAETGRIPTDRALDLAMGGNLDGTDEEMIRQTFGALTDAERAQYRLGYWLHQEGQAPADATQQQALQAFRTLHARLEGELGDDDLQDAMDRLLGLPSPAELQTEEGRLMAAGILRHRMQDKQALSAGLADAFTDADETRDQSAAQLESAYQQAMTDGVITADELAVLAALDAQFAQRYAEHVQTVDLVRNVASTVAAVAVGVLVTVITGGTAGPAVGGLLAQYGAAALAGGVAAAAAKVGTAEAMAGDHYDAMSSEGAADAAAGFADGATAVLSAGLAARFTTFVGLSRGALASQVAAGALESTAEATAYVGRRVAGGAIQGALEGFLAGAVGELVLTMTDQQTWRQSVWDVVCNAGLALLRGGALGAATGGVMGGAAEALSAVLEVRRVPALLDRLDAAGISRADLEQMDVDVVQALGRAEQAAAGGNTQEARQILDGLRGKLSNEELVLARQAITGAAEADDDIARHVARVQQLNASGQLDRSGYHGTNSEMLGGLEQTDGQILSAEQLHQRNVQQVTGEGDAFSGASGRKQFISIGEGEAGLGTSLAYAEAGGNLNHYNVQRYTVPELEEEIARLRQVVDRFDELQIDVNGPIRQMGTKDKGQFVSQLEKLQAELDLRMMLPSNHPRRLGGAANIQNYPVLFEFDTTGLNVQSRPDVSAGSMLGGEAMAYDAIDLRERLLRAYVPMDQVAEVQTRLTGVLGHTNFEVIAIEALDALPEAGVVGSTRAATYQGLNQLQDTFIRIQVAYAEAVRSGQTVDAMFILERVFRQ